MSVLKAAVAAIACTVALSTAAGAALAAAPVWQGCGEIKGGRFENSKCSVKGTTKAFDWLEENYQAPAATSEGALMIADTKTGLSVKCTVVKTEHVGSKGNASLGEVTAVKASGCETIKGTCSEPTVEAANLPWKTELALVGETEIRDHIKSAEAPAWKILCSKAVSDTCKGATSVKVTSNEKEGVANTEYEGNRNGSRAAAEAKAKRAARAK